MKWYLCIGAFSITRGRILASVTRRRTGALHTTPAGTASPNRTRQIPAVGHAQSHKRGLLVVTILSL